MAPDHAAHLLVRQHRAYLLSEAAVDAAFLVIGAIARWKRRFAKERELARLHDATRHLSERMLRDVGLWDVVR